MFSGGNLKRFFPFCLSVVTREQLKMKQNDMRMASRGGRFKNAAASIVVETELNVFRDSRERRTAAVVVLFLLVGSEQLFEFHED